MLAGGNEQLKAIEIDPQRRITAGHKPSKLLGIMLGTAGDPVGIVRLLASRRSKGG